MVQITTEGKATIYEAAIVEALEVAAKETGSPDISAALGALTNVSAVLIAKLKDRNTRRICEKQIIESLGKMVTAKVNERLIREAREGGAE